MPLTGILRSWNDDRGFGFIAPTHGGPELFVHVSAFRNDGARPTIGEKLTYEIGRGKNGKPEAIKILRAAIGIEAGFGVPSMKSPPATRNWISSILVIALLSSGVAYGFKKYKEYERRIALENSLPVQINTPPATSPANAYQCNGRTMCSQMTSCAEATWVLNNCPGTKMDGNHDGIPCEQQWCAGNFTK